MPTWLRSLPARILAARLEKRPICFSMAADKAKCRLANTLDLPQNILAETEPAVKHGRQLDSGKSGGRQLKGETFSHEHASMPRPCAIDYLCFGTGLKQTAMTRAYLSSLSRNPPVNLELERSGLLGPIASGFQGLHILVAGRPYAPL